MTELARGTVSKLPPSPGVYRFRDARGRVLYIGRATDLRHRVGSYWSDLGDRGHLSAMVRRIVAIEAVACDSQHEAAWLERNLLEMTLPRWNRMSGGGEVPVYIRLDGRERRPGLTVVHLPEPAAGTRLFGPYLGGSRVRLAVAALHRILPLAYAGTGLTGMEFDMGRQLGVSHLDHRWIVDAIAAVLARNDDAVSRATAALGELRDAAAESTRFELAARIEAELQALAWVTSPQRVTLDDGDDIDAFGWSEGLLVHFAVRAGRLSAWSQRPCSESRARGRLESTPAAWTPFVQRAAELAAVLAAD